MWYSKVITRAALDQRKQNRRGSLEKLERTSSKLNTSSRNLNNSHNLSLPPHNPPCKKDHCLLNSLQFNGSIGEKLVLYYVSVFEGIHRYLFILRKFS